MALFLFLAGFGCNESYKYKGLGVFGWKKVKRLLLSYAIVVTLICVISQKWNLASYLFNIIGLQTSFWFIAYLMKWYIVFWVTTQFLLRYRITVSYELIWCPPLYTYLDGRLWAIALLIGSFMIAYGFNKFNLKISKLLG